jgi:hypothetical protein
MPINPFDALKSLHLGAARQLSPEEQAAQDAQAQQAQAGDAGWQQWARKGIEGGVGMVKGALGVDDGSQGLSPNHLTQMGMAALPLLPGGFLGRAGGLVGASHEPPAVGMLGPRAAQAASRSASEVFNPAVAQNMENMYHEARPAFEGLQSAGAFGGDRSVGGIHQLGTGANSGLPEFAAVGDEGLFNAQFPKAQPQDAKSAAVAQLLKQGGQLR